MIPLCFEMGIRCWESATESAYESSAGGHVCRAPEREYGKTLVHTSSQSPIFQNVSRDNHLLDEPQRLHRDPRAPGFMITAYTDNCRLPPRENREKKSLRCTVSSGSAAHPGGKADAAQLCLNVCGCKGDWKWDSFVERSIAALREKIGDGKVLCALSGGVDPRWQRLCFLKQWAAS